MWLHERQDGNDCLDVKLGHVAVNGEGVFGSIIASKLYQVMVKHVSGTRNAEGGKGYRGMCECQRFTNASSATLDRAGFDFKAHASMGHHVQRSQRRRWIV